MIGGSKKYLAHRFWYIAVVKISSAKGAVGVLNKEFMTSANSDFPLDQKHQLEGVQQALERTFPGDSGR
jgi:hypothetical protein